MEGRFFAGLVLTFIDSMVQIVRGGLTSFGDGSKAILVVIFHSSFSRCYLLLTIQNYILLNIFFQNLISLPLVNRSDKFDKRRLAAAKILKAYPKNPPTKFKLKIDKQ